MAERGLADEVRLQVIKENLEHLRLAWDAENDPLHLWQALGWARGHPLPDWLTAALQEYVMDAVTSPQERQRRVVGAARSRMIFAVRDAFYNNDSYPFFYALDDENPTDRHFRIACERLNAEGLRCSFDAVKKAWHRHKPLPWEEMLRLIVEE